MDTIDDQYENGIVTLPINADEWPPYLDQIGKDGWSAWAVLGVDPTTQKAKVGVKRLKHRITLATELPSGLITS